MKLIQIFASKYLKKCFAQEKKTEIIREKILDLSMLVLRVHAE